MNATLLKLYTALTVLSMSIPVFKQTYVSVRQLHDKDAYIRLSHYESESHIKLLAQILFSKNKDLVICYRDTYSASLYLLKHIYLHSSDSNNFSFPKLNSKQCVSPQEISTTIFVGGGKAPSYYK